MPDQDNAFGWSTIGRTVGALAVATAGYYGLHYVVVQAKRQGKPIPLAPGSKPTWKGGSIPVLEKFMTDAGDFDLACGRILEAYPELKDAPMFEFNIIINTFVIVTDPDAQKEIVVQKNYPKSHTYANLAPFIGSKSLAITREATWKPLRKAFNPSFSFAYLRTMVPIFTEQCAGLIKRLDAAADAGDVIMLHSNFVFFALDVIYKAVLSTELGFMASEEPPLHYQVFMELQQICADTTTFPFKKLLGYLPWNRWHRWYLQKTLDTPILKVVNKRLADRAAAAAQGGGTSSTQHQDILSMALNTAEQEGTPLKPQEILDQVKTFLFAGHDTTASTMAFAVYEISKNPDVERQVLEEVDRVLGGRVPTVDDLAALKYLNAAIKETLRYWPVAGTARVAPVGATVKGYDIGGKVLYMPLVLAHRDKRYWGPDADVFKPERWFDEAYVASVNPNSFLPFSKGARDCIGQTFATLEMKAVLAMLFQRFTFKYAGETPETMTSKFTAYPKYRVPMTVHRRPAPAAAPEPATAETVVP